MKSKVIPLATRRKPVESVASAYQIYLSSLAKSARSAMASQLKTAIQLLGSDLPNEAYPWHEMNFEKAHIVRAALLDLGYSVNSINLTLSGIRGIAKTAFNLGQISGDDLLRINSVKNVKGSSTKVGRNVSLKEIRKLIAVARKESNSIKGARSKAILLVGFGAGLRCSEICSLQLSDFDAKKDLLTIRKGKGRKRREVYLAKEVSEAIQEWVTERGRQEGPLFLRILRYGLVKNAGLSTRGVAKVIDELQQEAEVEKFTMHDMRRTFITRLLEQGIDINVVRQLAGHSDVSTTIRYDRRDISWQKQASQSITFKNK
ncbi:MAG: tyrosine-type recombinase/integrase [Cellvibrionaceae bacterium]